MNSRYSAGVRETCIAGSVDQPCCSRKFCGPFTASSNRGPVRAGRSKNRRNSTSLLPPTFVKLSIVQLITDVYRFRRGASSDRQSDVTTGCQVFSQLKSPVGTLHPSVPMFDPNVNRCVNPRKNVTYQASFFAMESWVNAGSESMNTRRGMRAYSSRQNQAPPERFTNRSAVRAYSAPRSRDAP